MKRIFSAAAVLTVFAAFGCAPVLSEPQAPNDAASATAKAEEQGSSAAASDKDAPKSESAAQETAVNDSEKSAENTAIPVGPWGAGDFITYRFSGSFRKAPVTLTEKVVSRNGDTFALDVTFDDGKTKESIRVEMRGDSPAHAEVLRVSKLAGGVEQPAKVALFDEIMGRVALVADQNEAQLGSEQVKIDVSGYGSVACEKATFRVKVGNQTATMKTLGSASFAWGDLGAEITTAAGKVIYKAEVVDAGHETAKPAIASSDDDY